MHYSGEAPFEGKTTVVWEINSDRKIRSIRSHNPLTAFNVGKAQNFDPHPGRIEGRIDKTFSLV
jgi:hypothetical protein